MDLEDFVKGLYAGAGDARGELTLELARRMRSDIEPLRGAMYGNEDLGRADDRGARASLGVGGTLAVLDGAAPTFSFQRICSQ